MAETPNTRRAKGLLSASFVVTLIGASGCKATQTGGSGATGPTDEVPRKPSIFKSEGEGCRYMLPEHCPPDVSCNPPPPMYADCPPEMRGDGGEPPAPSYARDTEIDDFRPANRAGWIRIRREFWGSQSGCYYTADRYCPGPDQKGNCEDHVSQKVPCQAGPQPQAEKPMPEGMQDPYWIPGFVGARAGSRCERYPGFWCDPSHNCTLPKGELVDCASNPPTGKQ